MSTVTPLTAFQQHQLALQARKQQQIELKLALAQLRRKWSRR